MATRISKNRPAAKKAPATSNPQPDIIKVSALKLNDKNPRVITDPKFKELVESIRSFPEMLNLRPIIVNKKMVVLGGNMRLRAAIEAGLTEVPYKIANLSLPKQREFIIKDNVSFGDWDWEIIIKPKKISAKLTLTSSNGKE